MLAKTGDTPKTESGNVLDVIGCSDMMMPASKDLSVSVLLGTRKLSSASTDSRLRFEFEQSGGIRIRHLRLDDKRAYEFGITCNTCGFWFERKEGANGSVSLDDMADALDHGLTSVEEETTRRIADCLPSGEYKR